jgi:hypothetical protein
MKLSLLLWISFNIIHSSVFAKVLTLVTDDVPGFEVVTSGSRSEIPDITVHFTNGISQKMILESYRGTECNYVGQLELSMEHVAVTGCLQQPGDRMDITLMSPYSPKHHMFSVDIDGNVDAIENPFKRATDRAVYVNSRATTDDGYTKEEGDEEVNEADEAAEEEIAARVETFTFPASLRATLKFGYENSMKQQLGKLGIDFKSFADSVMAHVQTYYKHATLGTQVLFTYDASDALFKSATWIAENNLEDASVETAAKNDNNIDLYAWWVSECAKPCSGVAGVAWLGTACKSSRGRKTSLNELQMNWSGKIDTAGSAYVLAHEMGHNLGMSHDFGPKHGGNNNPQTSTNPCNMKGIMSYGDAPTKWSTCSVSDFKGYYQLKNWGKTCFDVSDSPAPPGPSTPAPPAPATTAAPACNDRNKYGYCSAGYEFACAKYAWFKEDCAKLCNACGATVCTDKNARGYCNPKNKPACNHPRYPWFKDDCMKLCGEC